jgi:hypothetical protein
VPPTLAQFLTSASGDLVHAFADRVLPVHCLWASGVPHLAPPPLWLDVSSCYLLIRMLVSGLVD